VLPCGAFLFGLSSVFGCVVSFRFGCFVLFFVATGGYCVFLSLCFVVPKTWPTGCVYVCVVFQTG